MHICICILYTGSDPSSRHILTLLKIYIYIYKLYTRFSFSTDTVYWLTMSFNTKTIELKLFLSLTLMLQKLYFCTEILKSSVQNFSFFNFFFLSTILKMCSKWHCCSRVWVCLYWKKSGVVFSWWSRLWEPENSTEALKPGFAKYAVDAYLLRLGSTNPNKKFPALGCFFLVEMF